MKNVKTKSLDYIFGFIAGVSIMIAIYACTMSPLQGDGYTTEGPSGKRWDPIYVKIID